MYKIGSVYAFTDMDGKFCMGKVIEVHIYKEQGHEDYYLLVKDAKSGQKFFLELLMGKEQQEALNKDGRSYFGDANHVKDVYLRPKIVGTTNAK